MNFKKGFLGLTAAIMLAAPAFAGQIYDTTTVGPDNGLTTGVGSTGPGMSGYNHSGLQDKSTVMTSLTDGKTCERRIHRGFSRAPVYNNYADLALPHIR